MMDKVSFTQMKDGTREDYDFLTEHETDYAKCTADHLLKALVNMDESLSGDQITRLGHSLKPATRAERDGADTDRIVSALLHDIGDIFAPYNHDEYTAKILRLLVREQCTWVVEKHGDFQMLYYSHHVGVDPRNATLTRGTSISTTAAHSLNVGTSAALTPTTTLCPSNFLPTANPLIRRSPAWANASHLPPPDADRARHNTSRAFANCTKHYHWTQSRGTRC